MMMETIKTDVKLDTIADITRDELNQIIKEAIDDKMLHLYQFAMVDREERNRLTWDEVNDLADQYRWTPPPNAKTNLDLLREDRD